jgi:integrase
MPHVSLTQLGAERLRPAKTEVLYWDRTMPGFGLRVSPKGRKTFIVQYRVRLDGKLKERQETIGTLAYLTVAQARDRARQSKAKASAGIDPVAERRADNAAEEAERQLKAFTFIKLIDRYQREYADRKTKASSAKETKRRLARWTATLGDRPVRDITKPDIRNFLDSLGDKGLIEGNNLLAAVHRLFEWAREKELIEINPATGIKKPGTPKTRDRYLSHDEIKAFWVACDQVGWPSGPIFQLLLLTAQRENEVAGMRWSELDLAKKVWKLPKERTKNSKAHTVHLSDLSVEIIGALPQINGSQLVFAMQGDKPYVNFWHANQRVLRLMGDGVPHWVVHDLRRTGTTIMVEDLKVTPYVADKILNHVSGTITGVAAIYNRAEFLDERKAALEALGRFIERLIGREPDNVVELRQPA